MGKPDKQSLLGVARGVTLVSELGFSVVIPMVGGVLLGRYLDKRYGGDGMLFLVVFLLGMAAGLFNGYWVLRKAVEQDK